MRYVVFALFHARLSHSPHEVEYVRIAASNMLETVLKKQWVAEKDTRLKKEEVWSLVFGFDSVGLAR